MRQPTKRRHAEERSRVGAIPPRHAQQTNEHLRRASSDPCGAKQRSPNAQGKVEGWLGMWGEGGAVTEGGKGRKGARKLCEKGVGNIPPKHASGFVGPLWKQPTKRRRTRQGRGGSGYVGNGRCGERGGGESGGRKKCGESERELWGRRGEGRSEERGMSGVRHPGAMPGLRTGRPQPRSQRPWPGPKPREVTTTRPLGNPEFPNPSSGKMTDPGSGKMGSSSSGKIRNAVPEKRDPEQFRKNGPVPEKEFPRGGEGVGKPS